MDMQVLNKKGFLLIDSLVTVFVTSLVCVTCYSIFHSIERYEEGYTQYQTRSNINLEYTLKNMWQCQECELDESD